MATLLPLRQRRKNHPFGNMYNQSGTTRLHHTLIPASPPIARWKVFDEMEMEWKRNQRNQRMAE